MVFSFERLPSDAIPIAGGKGASLARMSGAGFPVPRGFVVSSAAFAAFLGGDEGVGRIDALMNGLDVHDQGALSRASAALRAWITSAPLPLEVEDGIRRACEDLGNALRVAVRSSAVSEDGVAASFAGQQETYLNVRGADEVVDRVRECWASFFSPRALFYRARKGALSDTRMAVVVQQMVLADKSGVMFTADPVTGRRDRIVVEGVFGLGEGIVSGSLIPDHYVVDRESGVIVDERVAVQEMAVAWNAEGSGTREVELSEEQGQRQVLTHSELDALRMLGLQLEMHFGAPQDVEWCLRSGEVFLLQSRPITTL